MFKSLNVKTLGVVFGILLLGVILSQFLKNSGDERNFRERLVDIDTAKITTLTLVPKGGKQPIILKRNPGNWILHYNDKNYRADKNAVFDLLSALTKLKPERLASTGKESWETYEVTETSGIRVKIEQGSKKDEIIIGKVSYQDNFQKATTYARVKDETEVYAISGFLVMNFNLNLNTLRDKTIGAGQLDEISALRFNTPEGRYQILRNKNVWKLDGKNIDSTKLLNYLQMITEVAGTEFASDTLKTDSVLYSLEVESNGKKLFEVKAFPTVVAENFIITSSANPDARFKEIKNGLINKIFVPVEHFLKAQ